MGVSEVSAVDQSRSFCKPVLQAAMTPFAEVRYSTT
jgi:hypothetical protein